MLYNLLQLDDGDLGRIRRSITILLSFSALNWHYQPSFSVASVPNVLAIRNEGTINAFYIAAFLLIFTLVFALKYILKSIALRDIKSLAGAKEMLEKATAISDAYSNARNEMNDVYTKMTGLKNELPSALRDAQAFYEQFFVEENGISRLMLFPIVGEVASLADEFERIEKSASNAAEALQIALRKQPNDPSEVAEATKKFESTLGIFTSNIIRSRMGRDLRERIVACKSCLPDVIEGRDRLTSMVKKFLDITEDDLSSAAKSYLDLVETLASTRLETIKEAVDASSKLAPAIRADSWDRTIEFWITCACVFGAVVFNAIVLRA